MGDQLPAINSWRDRGGDYSGDALGRRQLVDCMTVSPLVCAATLNVFLGTTRRTASNVGPIPTQG